MSDEFKQAYSELDLEDKINELKNEMKLSLQMLSVIKQALGVKISEEDVIIDFPVTTDDLSEILNILYFNFHIIQKNIRDIGLSITSE